MLEEKPFGHTKQFHPVTPGKHRVTSSGLHPFFPSPLGWDVCVQLFQTLVPLPLPSTMTHIFLLGFWGQEGKLPDLLPPFLLPHWGLFLEAPEGDSVPPLHPCCWEGSLAWLVWGLTCWSGKRSWEAILEGQRWKWLGFSHTNPSILHIGN